jgi:hypothetical protein
MVKTGAVVKEVFSCSNAEACSLPQTQAVSLRSNTVRGVQIVVQCGYLDPYTQSEFEVRSSEFRKSELPPEAWGPRSEVRSSA